jgi:hypothetical protein
MPEQKCREMMKWQQTCRAPVRQTPVIVLPASEKTITSQRTESVSHLHECPQSRRAGSDHAETIALLMNSVLVKIVAAWIIVLGVCPFTPPFSTCDFGMLHGTRGDGPGAFLKANPASDDSLALATACSFVAPLFGVIGPSSVRAVDSIAKIRTFGTALRL